MKFGKLATICRLIKFYISPIKLLSYKVSSSLLTLLDIYQNIIKIIRNALPKPMQALAKQWNDNIVIYSHHNA